jgi:hypothetical protein
VVARIAAPDSSADAASVPSNIIVRLSRRVVWARHDDAGRDTRSPGFPAGGAAKGRHFQGGVRRRPESGQANVQSNNYWSGTEYAPNPSNAWNFNTNDGNQNNNDKTNSFYALAVRPGE